MRLLVLFLLTLLLMVLENESAYEAYTYREIVKGMYKILLEIRDLGRLPLVNFAAGGATTPADTALMMQMGMEYLVVYSRVQTRQ